MKAGKYIIALLFFLPSVSYGQTVDFTYTTTSGLFCNPQTVQFTQACSGNPDGFIWRFGNGASGILPTDYATYTAPGTYAVTLIAIYADVAISVTKNITINPTPVVSFVADKYQLCQPGSILFTASANTAIATYEWDFGDGSPVVTTASNTASHFFNTFDEFVVTVKGITAAGCQASTLDTVRIKRFGIIDAGLDKAGGCIPINVQLSVAPDAPAGDPVSNFTWNFGDGSPTVTTTIGIVNHLYSTTAAITTAGVTMTTTSGCTAQYNYAEFGYGVPPSNPVAVTATGLSTFCASELIVFHGSANGASYFVWDYGDGIVDSVESPVIAHRYRTLGLKQVIMTPYFHGCAGPSDTIDLDIIGVVADYKTRNICSARNHFIYENLSLGNVSSFSWTFSDNPSVPDVTNYNTTHDFPLNGAFTTRFWLYDEITGCIDTLITNQYTATPVLTSTKTHVCKDSVINYKVLNPYPPGSGYLYAFHVDGYIVAHTIYPELIDLKPDQQGVFNEFVIISGPDSTTCDDTVYLPHPTYVGGPVLEVSIPTSQCFKNNSFPITNTSHPFFPSDPIATWDWNFGDGNTSNAAIPPPHSYDRSATYWIHFKVTDTKGCAQADSQLVYVYPTPEIFVLPRFDTICAGEQKQLLAFSVDNFTWTPTTNISCLTCDTVMVRPPTTTSYIAEAVNWAGCINRDTSNIKVYEPFALQVMPADTAICIGGKVQFNADVKGVTNWLPPRYLSATDISNPLSVPDSTITYQVIVHDSVSCFADTAYARVQVNYNPTVNAGNDQIVPYNTAFTVSPAYSADVVSWQWSPRLNGLSCPTCPVFAGTALETATHQIEVKNMHGCKANDDVKITVDCSKANLLLPTAFTPDNNGRNDWFFPLTRGYRTINKMVIYNRWGNKVFERNNFAPNTASLGWDGRRSDLQGMDAGVYVWFVEAVCDMGQTVSLKGTVTLVR